MHSFDSNNNIPTFILKLWKLVNNNDNNDLICWNKNGQSFIIKNQGRFAKELLPLYFKHSNMASFIRQLNMYGFRKLTNIDNAGLKSNDDEVEFYHPYFQQGQDDQLQFIKRKMANTKSLTSIVKVDEIQDILADVESIKGRQDSVDNLLSDLKQENEALWREIAILRQKHHKQQQIVEKLLQFLVSIVRNGVAVGGIKRKAAPLLLDSNSSSTSNNGRNKIMKNKDGQTIFISPPSSSTSPTQSSTTNLSSSSSSAVLNNNTGPIIHEIADVDEPNQSSPPSIISSSSTSLPSLPANNQQNQYINRLQLNLEPPSQQQQQSNNRTSPQPNEFNQLDLIPAVTTNILLDPSSSSTNPSTTTTIPELLAIDLDQIQQQQQQNIENEQIQQQQQINFDDVSSIDDLMKTNQPSNNNNNTTTTTNNNNLDLILPSKSGQIQQKANNNNDSSVMTKITSENFNDHVEGIDTELNWLQDQLYGGGLNIDPNTILGLFSSDNQFLDQFNDATLDSTTGTTTTTTTIPRAITDGPNNTTTNNENNNNNRNNNNNNDINDDNNTLLVMNNDGRIIKIEDTQDSQDFFGEIDFNNITTNEDKDILSDFPCDIDSSNFN